MRVYLVQHATPKPEEEDPKKPLSDEGRHNATKVAAFLKDIQVNRVMHSGKLRAQQTAEIIAKSLKVEAVKADALEPMADPTIWAKKLDKGSEDVILVGHLPHLNKLTSLLLCQNADKKIIGFQQGGVVCLEKKEGWSTAWMIVPDIMT